MNLLKSRIDATDERLEEFRKQRKLLQKQQRQALKLSRAERERKKLLIGEAVLARLAREDWDEDDFRQMMDAALTRPQDRVLFGLDEDPMS